MHGSSLTILSPNKPSRPPTATRGQSFQASPAALSGSEDPQLRFEEAGLACECCSEASVYHSVSKRTKTITRTNVEAYVVPCQLLNMSAFKATSSSLANFLGVCYQASASSILLTSDIKGLLPCKCTEHDGSGRPPESRRSA